jgi:hypothetical protein
MTYSKGYEEVKVSLSSEDIWAYRNVVWYWWHHYQPQPHVDLLSAFLSFFHEKKVKPMQNLKIVNTCMSVLHEYGSTIRWRIVNQYFFCEDQYARYILV